MATKYLVMLEPEEGGDEVFNLEVEAESATEAADAAVEQANAEGNGMTYRAYDVEES